jgi:hypothetical protein
LPARAQPADSARRETHFFVSACIAHCRLKPFVILTDLRDDYVFFWLDGQTIRTFEPRDAARAWGLFDAILNGEHWLPNAIEEGVVPIEGEGTESETLPIAKRKRLNLETSDAHVGVSDVANLADLEGFLSSDELRTAQMAQLLQQFFALPVVAAGHKGWEQMYA